VAPSPVQTMKCVIPEIAFHNRDPVLSLDFQPSIPGQTTVRLATAGSDSHVVIWSVRREEEDKVHLECLSDLTRHQRAVNIVRWSPDGHMLASGDDESVIIVWKMKEGQGEAGNLFDDGAEENKENWVCYKMLRFHLDDVYALSWSPCSQFLLSGSVDNTAIISNVHKNKKESHFSDSRGFIQGVAWNKRHEIVSTLASDRSCRSYNSKTMKLVSKTYKCTLNLNQGRNQNSVKEKNENVLETEDGKRNEKSSGDKDDTNKEKNVRLFHDDTFKGFFRRLNWSEDGEVLVVPSGVIDTDGDSSMTHCTWVFSRVDLSKPALCLPSKDKYTIAARFSPIKYSLRPVKKEVVSKDPSKSDKPEWEQAHSLFALPYRLIYAVATQNAVMFYDTQQASPFGRVSNIHYTGLTDLAWSPCGNILIVSSTDGFCSIVTFSPDELGQQLDPSQVTLDKTVHPTVTTSKPDDATVGPPTNTNLQPQPVSQSEQTSEENSCKGRSMSGPKRLQFVTLSSPKAEKKGKFKKEKSKSSSVGLVLDGAITSMEDGGQGTMEEELGVQPMDIETGSGSAHLSLVLEESQSELELPAPTPAVSQPAQIEVKKRVPLTTLANTIPPKSKPSTPEKKLGRRVNLITLSSPKGKP